ncbi:uncharacterized protein LOC127131521 [Lathyrus oleraceus]|uniref:uncharacterized protein LOC127131521 n=1 Tax=Pisum sativum TaxID=3888 RepID=UPI0021CF2630|nr:uncharacterized protein LOC127131521 [Pisum sativum]
MDMIKYIFEKPALTGRVVCWQMALTKYDIQHVTQKAIKGSVLSDYLAHHPMEDCQPMHFYFPNEEIMFIRDCIIPGHEEGPEPGSRWTIVFDGASNAQGNGIGAIITFLTGFHLSFTARLRLDCTNNMEEYEACIFGIHEAIGLGIMILEVYGDSTFVISQVIGDWEVRDDKLILYKEHVLKLIPYFDDITFHHIPRGENQLEYALATMASMFKIKWKNEAPFIRIDHLDEPTYYLATEEKYDSHMYFYDNKRYLEK